MLTLMLGVAVIGALAVLCSTRAALWSVGLYAVSLFIQNLTGLYLNSLRRYGLIALCKIVVNVGFAIYLITPSGDSTHAPVFTIYALTSAVVAFAFLVCALVHGWKCGYSFRIGTRFYRDQNRYAKYILPSTVCASVLIYSLSIAIPAWYSADQAGYFAAAYRFGFFPVSLIGQGIGGVFRRDAIEATTSSHAKISLEAVFKVYARGLLLIAVAYALFGALLFDPLIKNLFGQRWEGSATFFYLLLPMFTAQIIYVPLSQVFLAKQRQRLDFFIQLASGSSLLVVLYWVHLIGCTVTRSVFMFSVVGTACTLVGIFIAMRIAGISLFRRRFSAEIGDLNGSA
ncbi:MATE family efflux transporter [Paraburkholderia sediminicola]|uniref:translocase n=1 Tax=Paraburkholderia sediminicola TaxID=458836 RepID=UPI0038BC35D3